MTTIYHNPRCSKSREALQLLVEKGTPFTVVTYLEEPPTQEELKSIIKLLGIAPIALVRTQEAVWKEKFKGKELTDAELIKAMTEYPKLIERPIVINGSKAVIGRPPVKVLDIL